MDDQSKERIIKDSIFISKWKDDMIKTIKKIHPNYKKKEIDRILDDMLIEQMQIPKAAMDNNYTGEYRETNIISIFDWAIKREPLVAGNGTFYRNQHEAINPVAKMLDGFLTERKRLKKEMFKVEDKTSPRYNDLDRA